MTDCKSIGNKIVLKGVARLDAIYLDESGNLASMSSELPFSQILDGLAEDEGETTVRASLRLTGAEIHVGSESEPDNNRAISLRLYISAFTAVREVKSVCCVADLYSTAYDLTAKTETVELCDSAALVLREQLVREKIETGAEVQTVLATDVIFSSAGVSGGERARRCARRRICACCISTKTPCRCSPSGGARCCSRPTFRAADRRGCRTCTRARSPRPSARTAWSCASRNVCRQRGGNAALSLSSVA